MACVCAFFRCVPIQMNGEQLKIYSFWGILQKPQIATKIPGTPYPIEPLETIYGSVVSKLRRVSLQRFRQKKKNKKKNIKSA